MLKELIVEEHSDGLVSMLPHSRYLCRWRQMETHVLAPAVSHCVVVGIVDSPNSSQQAVRLSV